LIIKEQLFSSSPHLDFFNHNVNLCVVERMRDGGVEQGLTHFAALFEGLKPPRLLGSGAGSIPNLIIFSILIN